MLRLSSRNILFCLICIFIFVIFFNPLPAMIPFPARDEFCYLSFFKFFFGYPLEPKCDFTNCTYGHLLFWLPAGLVSQLTSLLTHESFNILLSIGIGLTSFTLWIFGFWLFRRLWDQPFPYWIIYLSFPVLPYVVFRSHLAHPGEFVLAILFMGFISKLRFVWATWILIWLICTRMNTMFLIPVLYAGIYQAKEKMSAGLIGSLSALVILSAFLFLKTLFFGYNERTSSDFLFYLFEWKNYWEILFGNSWGLVWTSGAFMLSFIAGLLRFKSLNLVNKMIIVQFALNFVFAISFKTHGSMYGYRVLIFSFVAMAFLMKDQISEILSTNNKLAKNGLYAFLIVTMTWQLLVALNYPYYGLKSQITERHPHPNGTVEEMAHNPDYQWLVLDSFLKAQILSKHTVLSQSFIVESQKIVKKVNGEASFRPNIFEKVIAAIGIGIMAFLIYVTAVYFWPRRDYGRQQR